MKTVKGVASLLSQCVSNMDRYKIPEPTSIEIESDEVDGLISLRWDKKCYLDIFDRSILVWGRGEDSKEFNDLDTAFRKVVEYV